MKRKVPHRTKVVSLKMTEQMFDDFVELAITKGIQPSTLAYLVVRGYLDKQSGSSADSIIDNLL